MVSTKSLSRAVGISPRRSRWEDVAIVAWLVLGLALAVKLTLASDLNRQNVYLKVFAPAAEAFGREPISMPRAAVFVIHPFARRCCGRSPRVARCLAASRGGYSI